METQTTTTTTTTTGHSFRRNGDGYDVIVDGQLAGHVARCEWYQNIWIATFEDGTSSGPVFASRTEAANEVATLYRGFVYATQMSFIVWLASLGS